MNFLEASRPSATISSVGAVLPWVLTRSQVCSVDSASTIMIATSSPAMRPATTMSKVERSMSLKFGKATHWSSIRLTRTPPIGPENGRPEIWVEALAALMASTSYWWSGLSASTVMTTWTSLRRPLVKVGRSGRSMRRQVRIASVDGRGEEVETLARGLPGGGGGQEHGVLVQVGRDGAAGLLREPAGLEPDGAGAERAVVDDGFGDSDLRTLHGSSFSLVLKALVHRRCARACPTGGGAANGIRLSREKGGPHGQREDRPSRKSLSAKAESLDQRAVALDVDALQVTQEAAALADQEQQATAAVVVVLVLARVLGEVLDPLGEQRDLHLGGAGVALGGGVLGHDLLLDVSAQRHGATTLFLWFRCAALPGWFTGALWIRGRFSRQCSRLPAARGHP